MSLARTIASFEFLINKKYKDYPNLINALMTRFDRYNEQCKRMKQLEEDGILMVLRPSHKYVKSFEMNTDVLDEAYNAGKNLAKEKLAEIEEFSQCSRKEIIKTTSYINISSQKARCKFRALLSFLCAIVTITKLIICNLLQ